MRTDVDPFALGTFVPVFDWVRAVPGVTLTIATCYGLLASYRGKGADGECRPSVRRLAVDLATDERAARRHLQKLIELGLIERDERPGKTNVYRFVDPGLKDPGVNEPGSETPSVERPLVPRVKTARAPRVVSTLQVEERVDPGVERAARASVADQIRTLEQRYESATVKAARDACALSRRTGTMADPVWLRALSKLATFPVDAATHAMQQMAERYADGEKNEAYMLGIARRHKPQANAPAHAPTLSLQKRMEQEVICEN